MKLAGKKVSGANTETVVLPRGADEPLVFTAKSVLDFSEFDALCPRPKPRGVIGKGGVRSQDTEAPDYQEALADWGQKRVTWLILTSLRLGTADLEWESVNYDDPNSWASYESELQDAGLNEIERGLIVRAAMRANSLDSEKLDEARENFYRSQRRPAAE